MIQPGQNIFEIVQNGPVRHLGTVDQNDRQAQGAGSQKFSLRARAASVFRHDQINTMVAQKGGIPVQFERPPRNHSLRVRQGQRPLGRVNQAQQIMVLWSGGESIQRLLANRQKHPRGLFRQRRDRPGQIGHQPPIITSPGTPWHTLKRRQGHASQGTGCYSIRAHPGRKGVGRIHNARDLFSCQEIHQAIDTAKPTDPCGQGLRHRRGSASGIGKQRLIAPGGKGPRQGRGFAGSAQNKGFRHG